MLAISLAGRGYVKADLWKDGKHTQTYRHRLVAQAFIGDIAGKEINHIDGDKKNNHVSNLEIVTKSENEKHSREILGNLCKPIFSINYHTLEIKEYPSIEATENDGFNAGSVYRCVYGKQQLHKNHYFYFRNPTHNNRQKINQTHPAPAIVQEANSYEARFKFLESRAYLNQRGWIIEAVKYRESPSTFKSDIDLHIKENLITSNHAPAKEWVGLSDDEIEEVLMNYEGWGRIEFARAIEQALREKNT